MRIDSAADLAIFASDWDLAAIAASVSDMRDDWRTQHRRRAGHGHARFRQRAGAPPDRRERCRHYAGATILGRVTVGAGAVIGGKVWRTESVAPGSVIHHADAARERGDTSTVPTSHIVEADPRARNEGIARA